MTTIQKLETPCLLVALPQLLDSNFQKTVILVIEHNSKGALGFVVNRPSGKPLKEILSAPDMEFPSTFPAWNGGPVGSHSGLVLHNQPGDEANSIAAGIVLSSSEAALRGILSYSLSYAELNPVERTVFGHIRVPGFACLYPYRFLVGYAGWGAQQLDEEMRQGYWLQMHASCDLLFNTAWNHLWNAAMSSVGVNPMEIAPTAQTYLN